LKDEQLRHAWYIHVPCLACRESRLENPPREQDATLKRE
jgi:hypothetical protein